MSTVQLLGCPFCGQPPKSHGRKCTAGDPHKFVHILSCFCGGYSATAHRTGYGNTAEAAEQDAAANWNTRFIAQ